MKNDGRISSDVVRVVAMVVIVLPPPPRGITGEEESAILWGHQAECCSPDDGT